MRKITLFWVLALITLFASAQTSLGAGDIAFLGMNTDGTTDADDTFAFVLLKDIDATTQIIFTDRGWNDGTGFSSFIGDGDFTWTSGSARTAGEVVILDFNSLSPANASFSYIGDQLFAIQGSIASPTFVAGLQFNEGSPSDDANWDGAATNNSTSALPDALTTGDTAVRLVPEQDNWQFSCSLASCPLSGTPEEIRTIIHNPSNWVSNNTTPYSGTVDASFEVSSVEACSVSIDTQPQSITVEAGTPVDFTVVASGTGTLSYNWQISGNGGVTFNDASPTANGTPVLSLSGPGPASDGNQYRVVVTSDNGTPSDPSDDCEVTSDVAVLNVAACSVSIDTQPQSITVEAGTPVDFTVVASGTGTLSYNWQISGNGGVTFNDASPTANGTPVLSLSGPGPASDGNQYRVVVTSDNGTPSDPSDDCQVISDVAVLTISDGTPPISGVLISEFQPNPTGSDPANVTVELSGPAGESFTGWLLSIESDSGTSGTVDRATEVSGTFDSNGLLLVSVPDFENPSFTVALMDTFTGTTSTDIDTDDDGVADDLTTFGAVYDAIGIPDTNGEPLYGTDLGGLDFAYTGDEPRLVFRDASVGDWYAINDPDAGQVFDITGTDVTPAIFDTDPTVGTDTFGAINPSTGSTADILISEFQPNPTGSDPANVTVELSGPAGESFTGWLLSIESDSGTPGTVDRATEVSGTFDANGLLLVTIPDFENPSFTVAVMDTFTGTTSTDIDADNDGVADDLTTFGTVYDAIGIPDTNGEPLYGTDLGGLDFAYTGDEPRLVFRDASVGDWYAINDPDAGQVFDITGTDVTPAIFDTDPTVGTDTFGAINPSVNGTPANVIGITATDAIKIEGNSGTTTFTFTVTRTGDTSQATSVQYTTTGDVDNSDFPGNLPSGTVNFAANDSEEIIEILVNGDTDEENDENFTITLSNPANGETLNPISAQGTIQDDDEPIGAFTLISAIQGSGASVAITTEVTVEAIVVGDFSDNDQLDGFFVQEEDADSDGNPATSEGIFVYCGSDNCSSFAAIAVGDKVQITGTPTEFNGKSQIPISSMTVVSSGNVLPTAPNVQLPVSNVADLEAYEGMLVNITSATSLVVNEHFNLDRFGEVMVSTGGGLNGRFFQYTQVNTPDATGYANHLATIDNSSILVDDGRTGQNLIPVLNARGGNDLSPTNTLRGGDSVSSITGVMDFAFSEYRIQPTQSINWQATNTRPTTSPSVGGTLKVASLNVLNFFTTLDEGGNVTGPNNDDPRGADDVTEYQRQLDKLVSALQTMNADIVGLVELENNTAASPVSDGTDPVLEALVDALNGAVGSGTYDFVDAGVIGDDVIKVAFIYKTTTVNLSGTPAILDTQAFMDPNNLGNSYNRPALAQTFTEIATNGTFTAVVNHLKSKGSPSSAVGADQDQNDGQGYWNDTRTKAAQALAAWLTTDPTGSGDPDFMILGDLNAYGMEDPIVALENAGFTDLAESFGGQYSFAFNEQWGTLDYVMANASLASQVTGAAEWHVNSDEPDALDYDTSFNDPSLYANDIYRGSDHDPAVVGLNLQTSTPLPNIVINEILADPASDLTGDANGDGTRDGSDDEFIEILNLEDIAINISGWTVADQVSVRHIFPENSILSSNCGLVLFGGGVPTGEFSYMPVQVASSGALAMNNAGDTVEIRDTDGNLVVSYSYGSEGGNDQSLTRDPDGSDNIMVQHSTAANSGGALFSLGTQVNGDVFSGCAPNCIVEIGTQPEDAEICEGDSLTFNVIAVYEAGRTLSYQWQVDKGDGNGFVNIGGPSAYSTLAFNSMQIGGDGNQYQVIITSDNGTPSDDTDDCSVTSDIATLIVNPLPTVTFIAPGPFGINTGIETGLGGGLPVGGVYSGTGVTDDGNGETFSFDTAFLDAEEVTVTYTYTNENGCSDSASDEIEKLDGGPVQCPDFLPNDDLAITLSVGSLTAGADGVLGTDVNTNGSDCAIEVVNNDNGQPWGRYAIPIVLSHYGIEAGDRLYISVDGNNGTGNARFEINQNNSPNTALGFSNFGSGWSTYETTITVPSGINSIDLWFHSNYTLSTPGTAYYDNLVVINLDDAGTNLDPIANAGVDQTVVDVDDNGSEDVALDGTGSTDPDGSIASYSWSENGTEIATGATPTVTLAVGVHTLVLTVTDNEGATDDDTMVITVNEDVTPGECPDYLPNEDLAIVLPFGSLTAGADEVAGTSTNTNGSACAIEVVNNDSGQPWSRYAIPIVLADHGINGGDRLFISVDGNSSQGFARFEINQNNTPNTSLGAYSFGSGWSTYDTTITVPSGLTTIDLWFHSNYTQSSAGRAAYDNLIVVNLDATGGNVPPVASAGSDQVVIDSDNTGTEDVTLDGSGSFDPDGSIVNYEWTEGATLVATGVTPIVTLGAGEHTLVLTVTDNQGATDTDVVIIAVNEYVEPSECSDYLPNENEDMVLPTGGLTAGGDTVVGTNVNTNGSPCAIEVVNNDSSQPWGRYFISINLADYGISAGDRLFIGVDGNDGTGNARFEINQNNTPNTALGFSNFGSGWSRYETTIVVPSGLTTIDLWFHSNYTLSTPGTAYYDNLEVVNLDAGASILGLQVDMNNMFVSPNPANITSKVSFEKAEDVKEILIFDMSGRMIQRFDADEIKRGDHYEMNVYQIPVGTYIVRSRNTEGMEFSKQMVIER